MDMQQLCDIVKMEEKSCVHSLTIRIVEFHHHVEDILLYLKMNVKIFYL